MPMILSVRDEATYQHFHRREQSCRGESLIHLPTPTCTQCSTGSASQGTASRALAHNLPKQSANDELAEANTGASQMNEANLPT
jgi:hypothetical protein